MSVSDRTATRPERRAPESAAGGPRWDVLRRDPRSVLLVLRLYLGAVFLYAGLSKIADSSFLTDSDPSSMHASVVAVRSQSPIGGLLGPVVDHSFAFGVLMALGETAVGIGILLGLLTRIASVGGMVLSLSLWLTVSWSADPWYTSADLVYLFAFTPLLLAGTLPYSVDAWLAAARRRHPGTGEDRTRRLLIVGSAGVVTLVAVGAASLLRRSPRSERAADDTVGSGGSTGSAGSTGSGGSGSGGALLAAADVPVGGAKQVTHDGAAVWVLQLQAGQYTALKAACPHQGCPVGFKSKDDGFACPCHGSTFDSSGKRLSGPAQRGLTKIDVSDRNGQIVES